MTETSEDHGRSGWPAGGSIDGAVRRAAGRVRLLVAAEATGGRLAAVEVRGGRGEGPPRHRHTREDELVYVLAGHVTFHAGDRRWAGPPGACVLWPRGVEHGYRVESAGARLLVVLTPAGLEGLYEELWGRDAGDTTDAERLITAAARYGVEITGPPPARGTNAEPRRACADPGPPRSPRTACRAEAAGAPEPARP